MNVDHPSNNRDRDGSEHDYLSSTFVICKPIKPQRPLVTLSNRAACAIPVNEVTLSAISEDKLEDDPAVGFPSIFRHSSHEVYTDVTKSFSIPPDAVAANPLDFNRDVSNWFRRSEDNMSYSNRYTNHISKQKSKLNKLIQVQHMHHTIALLDVQKRQFMDCGGRGDASHSGDDESDSSFTSDTTTSDDEGHTSNRSFPSSSSMSAESTVTNQSSSSSVEPSSIINGSVQERRSKMVRRQTTRYQKTERDFRQRRAPQLFEIACIVRLSKNKERGTSMSDILLQQQLDQLDQSSDSIDSGVEPGSPINAATSSQYIPKIRLSYPRSSALRPHSQSDAGDVVDMMPARPRKYSIAITSELMRLLPVLCYPDYTKVTIVAGGYEDECFLVTLTSANADRKFAYCCRYLDDKVQPKFPEVLVIISPIEAQHFYFGLLKEVVYRLKVSDTLGLDLLAAVFRKSYPRLPGQRLLIQTNLCQTIELENDFDCQVPSCPYLIELLGKMESVNFVMLLNALLCEKRVLLIADNIPLLSRAVQAAVAMLFPFTWPHTLIPVLPDCMLYLCNAPTPYLFGVLRSNLHLLKDILTDEDEEYLLIYDLDMNMPLRNIDQKVINGGQIVKSKSKTLVFKKQDSKKKCSNAVPKVLPPKLTETLRVILQTIWDESGLQNDPRGFDVGMCDRRENQRVADAVLGVFVELFADYRQFITLPSSKKLVDERVFKRDKFISSQKSKSCRHFLKWFCKMGIFQVWMSKKIELPKEDYFDKRIALDRSGNGKEFPRVLQKFASKFTLSR